jgi:alkanesulfonate monooxygenase SsuD/methylene tetrahydromethanopterin reductase-like flavin-dependent oxidoreductase (luciferase family)
MSDHDGAAIIEQYQNTFKPRKEGESPQVIVTVSAICAKTFEKAEEIALSWLIWQLQKEQGRGNQGVPSIDKAKHYTLTEKEKETFEKLKQNIIIGNPHEVKKKLMKVQADYGADELMIVTITHSPEDKFQSYQFIAEECFT